VKVAWITRKCGVRQRSSVCDRIDKGVEQNVGDQDKVINSVPPTNRWADKTNEPRT